MGADWYTGAIRRWKATSNDEPQDVVFEPAARSRMPECVVGHCPTGNRHTPHSIELTDGVRQSSWRQDASEGGLLDDVGELEMAERPAKFDYEPVTRNERQAAVYRRLTSRIPGNCSPDRDAWQGAALATAQELDRPRGAAVPEFENVRSTQTRHRSTGACSKEGGTTALLERKLA